MKKGLLYLFITITIVLFTACGSDQTATVESEENETEEVESQGEEQAVEVTNEDEKWDTSVGDVIKNEGGEFTLIARQDKIETQKTGPMILNIPKVNAISANIKGDLANYMETDSIEYIQIDMEVENTSEETITFYPSQATITTNTGEQLEANMWLSDHISGEFIGAVKKSGSQFFVLQNSKAEDIEWVRIIISAPDDENWNDVGEKLDFKVEF